MAKMNQKLREKVMEALSSVLPITAIVLALSITIVPLTPGVLVLFLFGSFLLIVGVGMFTLGVDMSMTPMGNAIGVTMSRARRRILPLAAAFLLGMLITVAEPDLTVLAGQVPAIPNLVLILTVAAGVGLFLVVALLRVTLKVPLSYLLVSFYLGAFVLAILFTPNDFIPVSFDSGGVTTGPITVPFIMALGVGICAIRNDRHAADDSFGLVALCSIGPILAVLILGMIFRPEDGAYTPPVLPEIADSVELWALFRDGLPTYMGEIALSLLPITALFGIFQLAALKLSPRALKKIGVGLVYTYAGLVLFLTGANVGFMPAGNYLGQVMAGRDFRWIIVPVGMVIGYFIVKAEPAVYVLNRQVEEITDGAIPSSAMGAALSLGVAASIGLAMVRVLTGISILWFLIPGYAIAIILSFFVPKIFTAIAFDSGGVASGPMTAAFLLPFAQGACAAVGGNIVTDAFGVVAMVAMTPLIAIQVLGVVYRVRQGAGAKAVPAAPSFEDLDDDAIIEL